MMKERIEHSGIIERITEDKIEVRILQSSACSACQARELCNTAESKEKIVECRGNGEGYHVGDRVLVYGSMEMGRDAVILAFVVPLAIVVAWLFVSVGCLHWNELMSIGCMVALLAVYYLVVHLFNRRISSRFEFQIEKFV